MADVLEREASSGTEVPPKVLDRMSRGRERMRKDAARRRMFYKFWRGDSYWYVNAKGLLNSQGTLSWAQGGTMPDHRIRNKYPFIAALVQAKVSAATQRVPGYEVIPSTTEPEDDQAAQLAGKVLLYGYDQWRLRRATTKLVEHALVGGEGFLYPFFDNTIGPFTVPDGTDEDGNKKFVGEGECRALVLSANEVYWEPGCDFEDSPWYVIEQAVPIDVLKDTPGYLHGDEELVSDATDAESPVEDRPDTLILRKEYLERPCPRYPQGRRLVIANGRLVVPEEPYPCVNQKGEVLDEPVMIRLSYIAETDDRDRGMVELLIDLQRTVQDCWNKILEIKNRGLNPQKTAPRGSNMVRQDDTPGAVWYYSPVGGQKPEWEPPINPGFLQQLFQVLDKALEHMRAIAADVDVQPQEDLAARTAQAAIEENRQRWQSFLGDLADAHSRIARRFLYLVQHHYTEERTIKVMGLWGPDLYAGFTGADLNGQADVRVSPESLAVKSRKSVIEEATLYLDRQIISPQAYMQAISTGNVDVLNRAYLDDYGCANRIIQTIKRGEDAIMALRPNPAPPGFELPPEQLPMAEGVMPGYVPGWMPRQFDNVDIWLEVFEHWMKSADWERLPDDQRGIAEAIYFALTMMAQQRMLQEQMQQEQMAQALGEANAAKPQQASPSPDQRKPALDSQG